MKGNRRSGRKFLSAMVALGMLTALNTPAYAMEENIISYGGYNVFKVQYFDAADKASVKNNIWAVNLGATGGFDGLVYKYTPLMKQAINGAFAHWAEILYRDARNMNQPAQFLVGTTGQVKNASAGNICEAADGGALSDETFYSIFQQGTKLKDKNLFISGNDGVAHAYGRVLIGKYI
ncbi:hypothetical protein, partial [Anaerovibrio sp.]|uniref:hypothetical protein n=1 Tax=Anaerovibrio sp. TaxID=1872532 RepID=UPI003F165618